MAAKKKSKSGDANSVSNHGETVVALFKDLDNGKLKVSFKADVEATEKEIKSAKTLNNYNDWVAALATIEEYGDDGKFSGACYATFQKLFNSKIKGIRLSKLVGDRLESIRKEFLRKDDDDNRIYDVVEPNAEKKQKMIDKVNTEMDKIEKSCIKLFAELAKG